MSWEPLYSHLGAERCGTFDADPLLPLFLGDFYDLDGILRCRCNQNDMVRVARGDRA